MARAFLSLSSTSYLTPPSPSLQIPSFSFKGNVTNLKPNPCTILSPRLDLKNLGKERRHSMVVVNKAAQAQQAAAAPENVRFRLNNLGPQPGSRKKGKRKGRGISAGQGNSCGFGMRGQKSRSGPGVRKGFEGGQMPLYRRIPKLRGIAGGNDYKPLNRLKQTNESYRGSAEL
ncbi:50S ribosomal protein L15 [Morus notabilis]|uniref:50S ribosomal protein L15 n=1 Tax=Morus notabilis TaxID=981085 RepID=W9RXF7_9ROSA|nr:50S ribosomal protein L15 [Morus notabilis]